MAIRMISSINARLLVCCLLMTMALKAYTQSPVKEIFPEKFTGFTGDLGLVSNYFFRCLSYSDDRPALQGGLDYDHISGLEIGTGYQAAVKPCPWKSAFTGDIIMPFLRKPAWHFWVRSPTTCIIL